MVHHRKDTALLLICLSLLGSSARAQSAPRMLEVNLAGGQKIAGMPVHWSSLDAAVIEPSGFFHLLDLKNVKSHRLLDAEFHPQSLQAARISVQRELGTKFETLVAGPYVIATPNGQSEKWRRRFISLYSGYQRYFQTRGWDFRQPDFPLVVIVFPSREDFIRYARSQGSNLPSLAIGAYFPRTNRCCLYQIPGFKGTDWTETEATIVHEAVHQLAYNTGGHERLFKNPLWFVEGFATMFEQPAIYDLGVTRSLVSQRANAQKLRTIKPLMQDRAKLAVLLQDLIAHDKMFRHDSQMAYALGWSQVFFLTERMPKEFGKYIARLKSRPFGQYSASARQRDFEECFGLSPADLANRMSRFYQEL